MPNSVFTVIGQRVRSLIDTKLDKTGGSISGTLVLSTPPTSGTHAVNKSYVDNAVGDFDLSGYAPLVGATFIGPVTSTALTSDTLTLDGTDVGVEEDFIGGAIASDDEVSVKKTEFDAVANGNIASFTGNTSALPTTAITTAYIEPAEISYDLSRQRDEGVNTIVKVKITRASQDASDFLKNGGQFLIGETSVTFY
jgi:hypothetical protein